MQLYWLTMIAAKVILIVFYAFLYSPYLSADLRLMASSFNTTVNQLEDELMSLILDGQIQARIDSHNKVKMIIMWFIN